MYEKMIWIILFYSMHWLCFHRLDIKKKNGILISVISPKILGVPVMHDRDLKMVHRG